MSWERRLDGLFCRGVWSARCERVFREFVVKGRFDKEDMAMRMLMFGVCLLGLVAGSARAEPYWIAYEGDVFPEEEGWWHIWEGAAERSLEDGVLVIDSLHDIGIADFYTMHVAEAMDPDPGELFVMEWRLKVEKMIGGYPDICVVVYSDEQWAVALEFDESAVYSGFEYGVSAAFEPGAFHNFRLESADMRSYSLSMDGNIVLSGSFWQSATPAEVSWGDGVQGSASLSHWDYFRFGVVPEPGCALLVFVLLPVILNYRECWR